MKEGYIRVSKECRSPAAGKLRKIRCLCTKDSLNAKTVGLKWSFFNCKETGSHQCPKCKSFIWYKY